ADELGRQCARAAALLAETVTECNDATTERIRAVANVLPVAKPRWLRRIMMLVHAEWVEQLRCQEQLGSSERKFEGGGNQWAAVARTTIRPGRNSEFRIPNSEFRILNSEFSFVILNS